jgi:hypothetical protein
MDREPRPCFGLPPSVSDLKQMGQFDLQENMMIAILPYNPAWLMTKSEMKR